MTGTILAGGENRRIKTDKSFLKVGNSTIIEVTIEKLRSIFDEVVIVVSRDAISGAKYARLNARVTKDILPGKGSLGGIY